MATDDPLADGRRLEASGQRDAAIETYRRAILATPDDPAGYVHLGELLYAAGFEDEARGVYDIGLRRLPASPLLNWARCMITLPMVPVDQGRRDAALASFAEQLDRLPAICFASQAALREARRAVGLRAPFFLPYLGDVDQALLRRHGRLAADIMAANDPARGAAPRVPLRDGERIRVGIVSGLFLRHAVWRMPTMGWVQHLDRTRFTLFGYHTRDERDAATVAAAGLFDRFQSGWAPVTTWCDRIGADAPHVLIYPELGIDQTSLQLAALPLAPLQCTSWGHPVTSGLPTIHAYLSSDAMEPPGADAQYTERLVRLPGLGACLDPDSRAWGEALGTGDAWARFGLPDDAVRILCCQSLSKFRAEHDDLLPRIARALPTARFVLVYPNERARDTLWRRLFLAFHQAGIPAEAHCLFVPSLGHGAFSALVRDAHVNLDTIGWSGCNTTVDALAHGVPTVTLAGDTLRARHSMAFLRAVGVTDTIAADVDDMVAIVARLGKDPAARADIAARLRAGAPRLFGDRAPVRALEDFLSAEVARRCADG